MPTVYNLIDASPTKDFFIDMLTRDISVLECVLDLIDNSIHNAIAQTGLDVMQVAQRQSSAKKLSRFRIAVEFDRSHFSIEDTCGGISISDAEKEVFRLGRPHQADQHHGLGVYGIGMKRAFFKLGEHIDLDSRTASEYFMMKIDVLKWRASKDWHFQFTDAGTERLKKSDTPGTRISIRKLLPMTARQFANSAFERELVQKIARTYSLFLRHGLVITVNRKPLTGDLPEFAVSQHLSFAKTRTHFDGVNILVMAGVTPRSDRVPRGWYIFCNGRMIVDADKSELTGWSSGNQWNPKYNHFMGWTLFASKNASLLPWRTTKDGVNRESGVYQHGLGLMQVLGRPVLGYLSRMYPGEPLQSVAERDVHSKASAVSVVDVAKRADSSFRVKAVSPSDTSLVNISYSRKRADVDRIRSHLGKPKLAASRVGELTFDWYANNVCKQ